MGNEPLLAVRHGLLDAENVVEVLDSQSLIQRLSANSFSYPYLSKCWEGWGTFVGKVLSSPKTGFPAAIFVKLALRQNESTRRIVSCQISVTCYKIVKRKLCLSRT